MQKICNNCVFYIIEESKCEKSNLYIIASLSCQEYKKRTKFNERYEKVLTKKNKRVQCKTIIRKTH